jgi:hypothetical protein
MEDVKPPESTFPLPTLHQPHRNSPIHHRIEKVDMTNFLGRKKFEDADCDSQADSSMVEQADEDTLDDQKTVLYRRKSRRVVDDPTDTFFTFAFSIGNKFEQPSKLNMARSKRSGQRRIWQFFIAASGRYDCRQFIEKVVIELPGKDSARSLTLSHPFEFSATTEISEIPYEIYWRPWTRHPRTRGMHQMGFGKNGCCENIATSFSVKAFQDFLRNSLSDNLK